MSNFGANFRKAREAAGLPLEKIAAETRISTRFLTAIENESFQLLPGGIFNRGFIRAYAEYLGLDSNQAVADYDRMSAASPEAPEILNDVERVPSRSSDWNLYLVAAALLVVLMVAYYFVTRKSVVVGGSSDPAAVVQPVPTAPPPTAPAPTEIPTPPVTPTATEAVPSAPANTAVQTAATLQSPPVPPPGPATPPKPSVPSALAVDLRVTDSTWVKVTTDGTVALSDILQAGTSRSFSAERSIDVVIGNAAGATMQINGRDLGQLGTSGRVREFRITPENAAQIR